MTSTETIYRINQAAELKKAWRELDDAQKRCVIAECERQSAGNETDIERIIEEVVRGQRRLF